MTVCTDSNDCLHKKKTGRSKVHATCCQLLVKMLNSFLRPWIPGPAVTKNGSPLVKTVQMRLPDDRRVSCDRCHRPSSTGLDTQNSKFFGCADAGQPVSAGVCAVSIRLLCCFSEQIFDKKSIGKIRCEFDCVIEPHVTNVYSGPKEPVCSTTLCRSHVGSLLPGTEIRDAPAFASSY